jgi:hypothetical protein
MSNKPESNFQPKGSMCQSCTKVKEDCSSMKFDEMPVIMHYGLRTVVKCTNHQRRTEK